MRMASESTCSHGRVWQALARTPTCLSLISWYLGFENPDGIQIKTCLSSYRMIKGKSIWYAYCRKMSKSNGKVLQQSHCKEKRSFLTLLEFRRLLPYRKLWTSPSSCGRKWVFQPHFSWLVGCFCWYERGGVGVVKLDWSKFGKIMTMQEIGPPWGLIQKGFICQRSHSYGVQQNLSDQSVASKQDLSYASNNSVATSATVTLRRLRTNLRWTSKLWQ